MFMVLRDRRILQRPFLSNTRKGHFSGHAKLSYARKEEFSAAKNLSRRGKGVSQTTPVRLNFAWMEKVSDEQYRK